MKRAFTNTLFAIAAAIMCISAAFAADCPGSNSATGDWYDLTNGPYLMITYEAGSGKIFMTQDYAAGEVVSAAGDVETSVHLNSLPWDVLTDTSTGLIYFTLREYGGLKVVNSSGATITTIKVGNSPYGIAISELKKRLYVTNTSDNSVSVVDINPASGGYHRVIKTITVGSSPMDVAVDDSPGYGRVYVANRESRTLSVIDENLMKVVGQVPLSFRPSEIAVNPSTHKIYVINSAGGPVTVVNGNSVPGTVQTTFTVGSHPWGIAVHEATNRIVVTDYNDMTVTFVNHADAPDGTTYTISRTDTFPSHLRGIYVDQTSGDYYVASDTGYSRNGAPCNREYLDTCLQLRSQNTVDDAAVERFLDCYFHQM